MAAITGVSVQVKFDTSSSKSNNSSFFTFSIRAIVVFFRFPRSDADPTVELQLNPPTTVDADADADDADADDAHLSPRDVQSGGPAEALWRSSCAALGLRLLLLQRPPEAAVGGLSMPRLLDRLGEP